MGDGAASPRVIGRILSLGFPLPGIRVDNYNFLTAPSFFDYDALVVDPSALSKLIEGVAGGSVEAKTFGDQIVRNVPASPADVSLADVLLRRSDETRALLDHGGVVICFSHPSIVHSDIVGVDALHDYYWLEPAAPDLVAADGTQAAVADYQHPLAPFVLGQLANIAYHAQMPNLQDAFVRSYGGAAIGGDVPSESGRIVMLPALKTLPSGDGRYTLSESLQSGIRRMLGIAAEGRPPFWVPQYPVPGLTEHATAAEHARDTLNQASAALADAERAHDELARYQRLLWQKGQLGLEDVVLEALRLIGCDVYANDPNALELRIDSARVLLEIDASDGAVDMAPHYRLRQRIERVIERTGEAPRGLIVINGHRLAPPDERPPQASDALRTAAETMRYALAPTVGLYEAVVAYLSAEHDAVAAYRTALATACGLLEPQEGDPTERVP